MKRLRITVEGKSYEVEVEMLDEVSAGSSATAARSSAPRRPRNAAVAAPAPTAAAPKAAAASGGDGSVVSPLAAVVVSVDVAVGATVAEGQKVVTLEAMKMNTVVTAHRAGTVKAILVESGDGVEEGQALIDLQ
jgi:biotin carboxyl carrier protein